MPLLFYFPYIIWMGMMQIVQDEMRVPAKIKPRPPMSQLDQERVEEIKSLAEKRATLEQIISGIAKDRLIQAGNGLPASGTIGSVPSPIETPSAILQVGPAKPEATTNDKKVRLPSRKRAAAVRRQTQEPPTVTANPNASRPEMQNY